MDPLSEKIVRLVRHNQGIGQNRIVDELVKGGGATKTPIVNRLKSLVDSGDLQRHKRGKAVEYTIPRDGLETHEEVEKGLEYHMKRVEAMIGVVRKEYAGYTYDSKYELYYYFSDEADGLEKRLKESREARTKEKHILWDPREVTFDTLRHLDGVSDVDTKEKLAAAARAISSRLEALDKEAVDIVEEIRRTRLEDKRVELKREVNHNYLEATRCWENLTEMETSLSCSLEPDRLRRLADRLHDIYVKKKPDTDYKIVQILRERKTTVHLDNFVNDYYRLRSKSTYARKRIAESRKNRQKSEDEDERASLRQEIEHLEGLERRISECMECVLKSLNEKVPLPDIAEKKCPCMVEIKD